MLEIIDELRYISQDVCGFMMKRFLDMRDDCSGEICVKILSNTSLIIFTYRSMITHEISGDYSAVNN